MYNNIVLSGGGVKGFGLVGALQQLEELEKLKNINNYAGASVGSLLCCLLALSYTIEEIKQILIDIDYDKILDDNPGIVRDIYNLVNDYGYAPGDYIYKKVGQFVKNKTGNKDYTLEDLYYNQHKKLIIATTNLSTRSVVYLQAGHPDPLYSNIPIRKAIRMSMSIPFVFEPVKYNDCLYVDAGCTDNFPIGQFDPGTTLGLKLVSDRPEKEEINNLYEYCYSYIETFLSQMDLNKNKDNVIVIKTAQYSLSTFNITEEEKQILMNQGKEAVQHYFKNLHILL